MPRLYRLGAALLAVYDDFHACTVYLPGGYQTPAMPEATPEYQAKALEWGFADAWELTKIHEP